MVFINKKFKRERSILMRLVVILILLNSATAKGSFDSSAFISIASHTITTSKTAFTNIQQSPNLAIYSSYKTTLFQSKKKTPSSVSKGGKIQVKLLKDVAGTGRAGETIMVAPAFFSNKLLKTKSAIRISDKELERGRKNEQIKNEEKLKSAKRLKDEIEAATISFSKKAGPDGQIFGKVGDKNIMGNLKEEVSLESLGSKQVKVVSIKDKEGITLDNGIHKIGEYQATLSLLDGISALLNITVSAD